LRVEPARFAADDARAYTMAALAAAVRSARMATTDHPRSIRSFVTRAGRITEAQQRALAQLWPKYGIEFAPETLEPRALYGRDAPRILEIGFGNGENLAALARAHPEQDFLGIEVHRPGVGRLLRALESQQLTNVRLICHDAVEVLARQIASQWLQEILIFFPDPWPKKRHHKRRLLQPAFVQQLAERLVPGGVLRIATDWQPYALEMLATLAAVAQLQNLAADGTFVARPAERQLTRFERRGARLGHEVWDLAFRRI
jgi:tRNA (guanine-N7-)-methyltransferase